MLTVVQDPDVHAVLAQNRKQRGDRPVSLSRAALLDSIHKQGRREFEGAVLRGVGVHGRQGVVAPCRSPTGTAGKVFILEGLPQLGPADFAADGVGAALNRAGEFNLCPAGQVQAVLVLEQVGNAAFARLRVDPDHRFVAASYVLWVDGQVGNGPRNFLHGLTGRRGILLHPFEALLNGVLMRPGERRENKVATVGRTFGNGQLVAVFSGASNVVDIGEVNLRVYPLAIQVHSQGNQIHVPGPLAVAKEAAFDAVGAGKVSELSRGHTRAAVVMRMQGEDDVVPVGEIAAHPFDGVRINVGRCHFNRGRQVEDHLAVC